MGEYLWLAVTPDKYELPIAVADSAAELGRMLGTQGHLIYKMYYCHNKYKLKRWKKYKIVKIKT